MSQLEQDNMTMVICQHDEALSHWSSEVCTHLKKTCSANWCGHGRPTGWASKSPDMMLPPHQFLCVAVCKRHYLCWMIHKYYWT